jgi:hypothetical protein
MKANWRRSQERSKPRIDPFAIKKFELRTELQDAVQAQANELDEKRWEELNAYATAVDATIMMTLHRRYRFTARVLRQIYEDMVRLRVEYRHFFRGEGYELQKTGKNIEDTAILHDLMTIGVDIKAWEEGIEYDTVTGQVTFGG